MSVKISRFFSLSFCLLTQILLPSLVVSLDASSIQPISGVKVINTMPCKMCPQFDQQDQHVDEGFVHSWEAVSQKFRPGIRHCEKLINKLSSSLCDESNCLRITDVNSFFHFSFLFHTCSREKQMLFCNSVVPKSLICRPRRTQTVTLTKYRQFNTHTHT